MVGISEGVWRKFVVFSNVGILITTICLWTLNLNNRWGHITNRMSRGLMQRVYSRKPLDSADMWMRLQETELACQQGDVCEPHESYWHMDYLADPHDLSFMSTVDVPVLTVLAMWVSTSYAIFSLPNDAHEIKTGAEDSRTNRWGLLSNWIIMAIVGWNMGGVAIMLIFALARSSMLHNAGDIALAVKNGRSVPASIVAFTVLVLVWTTGVQLLWILIGRNTKSVVFASISKDAVSKTQNWVHFARVSDIAFVFPVLLVCYMSVVRNTSVVSDLQYVFGFAATGLTILVPHDVFGIMAQEQIAYVTLMRNKRQDRGVAVLMSAATQQCVDDIMKIILVLMPRIALVAVGMFMWSLTIYYNNIYWWSTANAAFFPSEVVFMAKILPAYGIASACINLARSYFRLFRWQWMATREKYVEWQQAADFGVTITWDVIALAFRSTACLVLAQHAYS